MPPPKPGLAYALLTLAALFWTGNWVAGRMLADLVPPSALTFWRWAIALAVLLPFVGPRLWAARGLLVREWRPIVALGLLGGGLHNVLQYWGLDYTLATNGAILNATTPVLIIVLGTLLFRDPFPRRAAAGALIALAGTLALITRLDYAMLASVGPNRGDLLIFVSMVMLSGYTVGLRRRPSGLDPFSFLACFAIVALVPVGIGYAIEHAAGLRIVLSPTSIGGMLYIAIFPALLAYLFWDIGVRAVGAARAGVFMYLMPVFGTVLGMALLGERFALYHAVGMGLIFAGVAIATRAGRA
jgi:drug/metabolite transporter (DMT)-like permease